MALKNRESFSSFIAFVWVSAGAAIGLGNIWKFPYMAGNNGGSAFVLMYLVFLVILGIPVMIGEISLGAISKTNIVDGFNYLCHKNGLSVNWRFIGYLGALSLFLIFCFYSVIAGMSIAYIYFSITNTFTNLNAQEITNHWTSFLNNAPLLLFCAITFIFTTMTIVYFGVRKGIERTCTWMMPTLLLLLIFLVFYSYINGDYEKTLRFLFSFNLSKITPGVIVSSLGHALFTLAVGACAMMLYGSYVKKGTSIIKSALCIAGLDVAIALIAGLAIFPLVFKYGLEPNAGPGLMFISLPIVFSHIQFGAALGTVFFILLFFTALTSSLSFAEPLVDLIIEKTTLNRHISVFVVSLPVLLGASLCSLSFNKLSHLQFFNRFNLFELIAEITTNVTLPLGALGISLFSGLVIKQYHLFKTKNLLANFMFTLLKCIFFFIAPLFIFLIMVSGFITTFIS